MVIATSTTTTTTITATTTTTIGVTTNWNSWQFGRRFNLVCDCLKLTDRFAIPLSFFWQRDIEELSKGVSGSRDDLSIVQ